MNADLDELVRASPEGHGAEFTRDATGRRPWRELVLYDGEKAGWDAKNAKSAGLLQSGRDAREAGYDAGA